MVIPTRRRGGRMPLKPPPFHTSKSIVYVDCSIYSRETCSSRLCAFLFKRFDSKQIHKIWQQQTTSISLFSFYFDGSIDRSSNPFNFLSWGAVTDWNDGDLFSLLLTYRPSTESESFWWKDRQEFFEWREKVAATAVMELYVNLAPFPAMKQAPDFPLQYSTFMQ